MGFKIISEKGVASGTRRIEAITGKEVMNYLEEKELKIKAITDILKCKETSIISRLEQIVEENRMMKKEIENLKMQMALSSVDDILAEAKELKGIKFINKEIVGMMPEDLRNMAEVLVDKDASLVVVLASSGEDKINYVCAVGKDAQTKGAHAGKIVKEVATVAGGGGGGKPNFAQAGGKNIEKLGESIDRVIDILSNMITD